MNEDESLGFPTKENAMSSGSHSSKGSLARKRPKFIHDLEGQEKTHTIKEIKASLQKKLQDNDALKLVVGRLENDDASIRLPSFCLD